MEVSTWICSISLLTVVVAHLHLQAGQATVILMPTKTQIIISNSVNSILSRPVLGTVLAIDSVPLKTEELMAWLHHTVSVSPLVAIIVNVKQLRNVHQTLLLIRMIRTLVLIINCLSLLLSDSGGGMSDFSLSANKGEDVEGPVYLRGEEGAGLYLVSRLV